MNEAETRAEHIDHALKAAGWGVVDGSVFAANTILLTDASRGAVAAPSR